MEHPGHHDIAQEGVERCRQALTSGFTEVHSNLLDLLIGSQQLRYDGIRPLKQDRMDQSDIEIMKRLLELEFLTSAQRDMEGTDEASAKPPKPNPFDVYLMETTFDRRESRLAVYLPTKKDELVWYNGRTDLWGLDPPTHKWRVSSLAGPARVMQALSQSPSSFPLMLSAMQREQIIDISQLHYDDDVPTNLDACMRSLNRSQKQAVMAAIDFSFEGGFLAIQGPPGCGKTHTLVAMVEALLIRCDALNQATKTILVMAPSNAAVANVAFKFWWTARERLDLMWHDVVVHGENCDPSVQFLNPRHRGEKFALFQTMIEDQPSARDQLRLEFLDWLCASADERSAHGISMPELAQNCPRLDMTNRQGRKHYASCVQQARVVFSTLNSAGSGVIQENVFVETMLLDEAGQCTEAEMHIATTFPNARKLIAMGDPKQLPATTIDRFCRNVGYGRSWLESVYCEKPAKVHLLDTQYRMDPRILEFPNDEFYGNRIMSGNSVRMREPPVENPFMFVDTRGRGHEELDDFSWRNSYEATVIQSILSRDPDILKILKESGDARVLVITPYRSQVKLLRDRLRIPVHGELLVATVDSFQGQEAEIVIISTVRTHQVGFVDDAQRLNVALTRAKRVLRVVGDGRFFERLHQNSTLRKLFIYAMTKDKVEQANVKSIPWCHPNWSQPMLFKPIMDQCFHHCIQKMSESHKNICLNTLMSIARGDEASLYSPIPVMTYPVWYMSCLKGYQDIMHVVWFAKMLGKPAVQAVFAGHRESCLRFKQIHHQVPEDACIVAKGLAGMLSYNKPSSDPQVTEVVASWPVTNTMQRVLLRGGELPVGSVQLDYFQEKVAASKPPLIIESRSGTGKTLVLLQHAAYHADHNDERLACFVTVSRRLRNELEARYKDIDAVENMRLPNTSFFTLDQLLSDLLRSKGIRKFEHHYRCTYLGFVVDKQSYEKHTVEPHLVENEIGGVIVGSLKAARQKAPLSREQYLEDLRSNIGYDFESDLQVRHQVYDEFEKYVVWKNANAKHDLGDVVLELLQEPWPELFASAYLDEIQDFSYAAIFLICNLAGKSSLNWVCAGDPAQMISAGCSFTFDGLKQTLLGVQRGIESRLTDVAHLLVNYRTTKDVLLLANQVIAVARKKFEGSIPFARPEVAKKDLGLKVVLCEWKKALEQKVKLGTNQALVYSSEKLETLQHEMVDWIGGHPFIISSLQSKGLEFDDVIVAFDHDRKTWRMASRREAALRMLRELYVAITRAQRRVVILFKKSVPEMMEFYESLDCDFQVDGAELVLASFDTIGTAQEWREKARQLFQDENYEMSARCFDLAGDQDWLFWSYGKDWVRKGHDQKAGECFGKALQCFGKNKDYQHVLEVALALSDLCSETAMQWDRTKEELVDEAMKRTPGHLSRYDYIRLALLRNVWANITIDDLKEESHAALFVNYRGHDCLKKMMQSATEDERIGVAGALPVVVGDFYCDQRKYAEATRVFLNSKNVQDAALATNMAIEESTKGRCLDDIPPIVDHWSSCKNQPRDRRVKLLLELFRDPTKAVEHAKDHLAQLGRNLVILAVNKRRQDRLLLYDFSPDAFKKEIDSELLSRHSDNKPAAVRWLLSRKNGRARALELVQAQFQQWKDKEILELVDMFVCLPPWFLAEVQRRALLPITILTMIGSSTQANEGKDGFLASLVAFEPRFHAHASVASLAVAWALKELQPGRKKKEKPSPSSFAPLEGDPRKALAQLLTDRWPDVTLHADDKKGNNPELCRGMFRRLLDFCYKSHNPNDKRALLQFLGTRHGAPKACDQIVPLCLQQRWQQGSQVQNSNQRLAEASSLFTIASDVTHKALRAKLEHTSNEQLAKVFEIWIRQGKLDEVVHIVKAAVQSNTTQAQQRKEGILARIVYAIRDLISRDLLTGATSFTAILIQNSRIFPIKVLEILMIWSQPISFRRNHPNVRLLNGASDAESFLLLLLGDPSIFKSGADSFGLLIRRRLGPAIYRLLQMDAFPLVDDVKAAGIIKHYQQVDAKADCIRKKLDANLREQMKTRRPESGRVSKAASGSQLSNATSPAAQQPTNSGVSKIPYEVQNEILPFRYDGPHAAQFGAPADVEQPVREPASPLNQNGSSTTTPLEGAKTGNNKKKKKRNRKKKQASSCAEVCGGSL